MNLTTPLPRARVWQTAAGATVVAGGGLTGLTLMTDSLTRAQLNAWGTYWVGVVAAGLAIAAAIALWAAAAVWTAKRLTRSWRVRAAQSVWPIWARRASRRGWEWGGRSARAGGYGPRPTVVNPCPLGGHMAGTGWCGPN